MADWNSDAFQMQSEIHQEEEFESFFHLSRPEITGGKAGTNVSSWKEISVQYPSLLKNPYEEYA